MSGSDCDAPQVFIDAQARLLKLMEHLLEALLRILHDCVGSQMQQMPHKREAGCLYFPNCRRDTFSKTKGSGIPSSRKPPVRLRRCISGNTVSSCAYVLPAFISLRGKELYVSVEENREIGRRFVEEVINKKNLAAADEIIAEDFVELDSFPGQEQGREGLKQVLAMFFAAFLDLHWTTEEEAAEGDKLWSRFTWRGTHRGDFLGIPPTGNQVEVNGVVIDRIVEGKMVDSRILMNEMSLMRQLGVIPTPE